ncbi:MAG: glycosyltransferase family 2 protein [Microcoleaceae cyanobacterium]
MTNIDVSVIMPVYNCDRYISDAIASLLNQEFVGEPLNYEIIIIDDGSQDQTRQVVEKFSDPKINYYYQNNQGVSVARNHGIQRATGEIVAFIDADDFYLPDKLAAQVNVFRQNPELGIVHSGWRRVDQYGTKIKDETPWDYIPQLDLEHWLKWKPIGTMGTLMFRRDWLEKAGGFTEGLGHAEDVDLILRLSLQGCQAAWLEQVTICYRQHDQNTMRNGITQAQSINRVLENFFAQELPLKIRLMENETRYSTLVWSAWYLYYTGFYQEMTEYLKKSWQYKSTSPMETMVNWAENFNKFSHDMSQDFDADALAKTPEWQDLMGWMISEMTLNIR